MKSKKPPGKRGRPKSTCTKNIPTPAEKLYKCDDCEFSTENAHKYSAHFQSRQHKAIMRDANRGDHNILNNVKATKRKQNLAENRASKRRRIDRATLNSDTLNRGNGSCCFVGDPVWITLDLSFGNSIGEDQKSVVYWPALKVDITNFTAANQLRSAKIAAGSSFCTVDITSGYSLVHYFDDQITYVQFSENMGGSLSFVN